MAQEVTTSPAKRNMSLFHNSWVHVDNATRLWNKPVTAKNILFRAIQTVVFRTLAIVALAYDLVRSTACFVPAAFVLSIAALVRKNENAATKQGRVDLPPATHKSLELPQRRSATVQGTVQVVKAKEDKAVPVKATPAETPAPDATVDEGEQPPRLTEKMEAQLKALAARVRQKVAERPSAQADEAAPDATVDEGEQPARLTEKMEAQLKALAARARQKVAERQPAQADAPAQPEPADAAAAPQAQAAPEAPAAAPLPGRAKRALVRAVRLGILAARVNKAKKAFRKQDRRATFKAAAKEVFKGNARAQAQATRSQSNGFTRLVWRAVQQAKDTGKAAATAALDVLGVGAR